ncbi:MAG: NAD(P)-binding protein [Myxococcota bacterium]
MIGSGFGGSVSALRLAQKGYRVGLLERGKRYGADDFPKTNWSVRKYLWAPKLFCYGIQAITFLRDVMVLHGSGVGGGSLVYANTLLEPPASVFEEPRFRALGNWYEDLRPHYMEAKRMLGVTEARGQGCGDVYLRQVAQDMGCGDSFHSTQVGVFFGEPGRSVDDPYFGGAGPSRAGCVFCGGCMVGCRHNAKNTLDKNYLFFAEQLGVEIIAETEVRDIRSEKDGYTIDTVRVTDVLRKRRRRFTCGGVVMAAGVLGTLPLLFRCKEGGSLPHISDRLGHRVRTNSEALLGASSHKRGIDLSKASPSPPVFIPMRRPTSSWCAMGRGRILWRYWAPC